MTTTQAIATTPGLKEALCAISFFNNRHQYKDRTKAKRKGRSHNLAVRIKDHSKSGRWRSLCRHFVREARSKGFRGSISKALGL